MNVLGVKRGLLFMREHIIIFHDIFSLKGIRILIKSYSVMYVCCLMKSIQSLYMDYLYNNHTIHYVIKNDT